MDGLRAGTRLCCNMGFKPLAQAEDRKSPDWDADGRKRIEEARRLLPKVIDGWEHAAKRIGEKVVLTVQEHQGFVRAPMTSSTFIPNRTILPRSLQRNQVEGNELTVTLPVADYAPEKLGKLVGLLFHPEGWPGTNGKKVHAVSLPLE